MKTFTAAALAEAFEIDRNTMIRALRNTPPDLEKITGRPTYKIVTAAAALERHRRSTGSGAPLGIDTSDDTLAVAYAELDAAIAAMEAVPSLERRRFMAVNIVKPLLAETDSMLRAASIAAGQDAELVHLRADHLGLVMRRAFERPCQWSFDEALHALNT
jgi:hypothetical protein